MNSKMLKGLLLNTALVIGCSNQVSTNESKGGLRIGELSVSLTVEGLQVNAVDVTITGEGDVSDVVRNRSLNVSDRSAAVKATEGGLPSGNYTIALEATPINNPSSDIDESELNCSGVVDSVAVTAGERTVVNDLVLLCTYSGGDLTVAGEIELNAAVEVPEEGVACKDLIQEAWIGPQRTSVGASVDLHAIPAAGATGAWSASGGTIVDPEVEDTTFICPATPGTYELTYSLTAARRCTEELVLEVECVPSEGPVCGDLAVEGDEDCDDGNRVTESCDYGTAECTVCGADCQSVTSAGGICGDGVVNGPEQCDGSVGCEDDCTLSPVCGDGQVSGAEQCDDGNTQLENCDYGNASCVVCGPSCTEVDSTGEFCGDGAVNGPETCDGTPGCGDGCTEGSLAQACEACLQDPAQDPAFLSFNESCNGDPLCVAVKECMINDTSAAGGLSCFDGIPAECACGVGSDLTQCEVNASYDPFGPCLDEIVAGLGPDYTRLDLVTNLTSPQFATGTAYLIVDEATRICASECGFTP